MSNSQFLPKPANCKLLSGIAKSRMSRQTTSGQTANCKWLAALLALMTIYACGGGGGGEELDTAQQQVQHMGFFPPVYEAHGAISQYKAEPPASISPTLPPPAVTDLLNGSTVLPTGTLEYDVQPPLGADHVYIDVIYSSIAKGRWGISVNKSVSDEHIVFIPLPGNIVTGTFNVLFTYTANGQLSQPKNFAFTISRTPAGTYALSQSPLNFQGTLTTITPGYGIPTHNSQLVLTQNGSTLSGWQDGTVLTGTIYSGGWFSVANASSGDFLAGQLKNDGSIEGVDWHDNGGGLTSIYHAIYQPSANSPAVVQEIEPNNSINGSTPLGQSWSGAGTISSPNDVDYFLKGLGPGTYQVSMDSGGTNVKAIAISFNNGQGNVSTTTPANPLTFNVKTQANVYFAFSGDAAHTGPYQFSVTRVGKR